MTLNYYRVLLTRGRDGMVIFVPEESTPETFNALVEAGLKYYRFKQLVIKKTHAPYYSCLFLTHKLLAIVLSFRRCLEKNGYFSLS